MPARVKILPGDVRPEAAARRLGLTHGEFQELRPRLHARGFPHPDPDTGNYDLDAIDAWRRARNPQLFGLTAAPVALDARHVVSQRLARARSG